MFFVGVVSKPSSEVPEAREAVAEVSQSFRHPILQQHDAKLLPHLLPTLPWIPLPLLHGRHERNGPHEPHDVTISSDELALPPHVVTVSFHGNARDVDGRFEYGGDGPAAGATRL